MTHDPATRVARLSRREHEIAVAYAEGESHKQIAARLFLAPSTVRTHLGAVYRKLEVSSKLELLRLLAASDMAEAAARSTADAMPCLEPTALPRRASVAIMPLSVESGESDALARGLVQDIITRLAKLRSMRVIARGSVFALAGHGIGHREAADLLRVDYCVSGSVQLRGDRIALLMELTETRSAQIIWADDFEYRISDTLLALEEIGNRIVAAVAAEIETAERNRALLKPPESLDAWESFHRGLWHMYRFTGPDNEEAQALFRRAVAMDPTFSRAYAGLSFTHFQNAFLLRPEHREREVALAIEAAGESLVADNHDPAAHWAMGRALWLRGSDDQPNAELETSVELSPNFAFGHYTLAFVKSQSGDAREAIGSADHSRYLSPFDPLLFGMLGSRAMALFRLGAYDEAADWAIRAAARPNAHVHIHAIAAYCLAIAGRLREARQFATTIRRSVPAYHVDHFLKAFRFSRDAQARFRKAATLVGLD
jgi:TolB-like protein/DNA-binding CsgD family transcriptional regulator